MGRLLLFVLLVAALAGWWLFRVPGVGEATIPQSTEAIARGEYLVAAGGCISCHEDSNGTLSGGHALNSEFGTFYVSNITPDMATGIGTWDGPAFLRALKHGRSAEGGFYYPAFPYRAYRGLSDADVLDIAAYLMSLQPVANEVPPHETPGWLASWMMAGWNPLADLLQPEPPTPQEPQLARGAYLARNLGHCGECHTPRNALGMLDQSREFAGVEFEDRTVEAIDAEAMSHWSVEDFTYFLFLGVKPDGEFVGGDMETVIEHNTSRLTQEDQQALAAFFLRAASS